MNKKEIILVLIAETIHRLGNGEFSKLDPLLDKMKSASESLNDKVQEDILDFIQQVEFQKDYDPEHLITKEIKKAADRLIRDLKS